MCGFCGYYSRQNKLSDDILEKMTLVIKHRGPDATGFYTNKNMAMGHVRLSILDLSAQSNQPMLSQNKRYVMVYNGEVYNFKHIAQALSLSLKTTSDTEVVLEAFAKKGIEIVSTFNGMFAASIYDTVDDVTYLFRDSIGIKPLFYYEYNGTFAFASEIKALLQIPEISQHVSINSEVISYYMHLGYIPEPLTIYNHIYKFPSGHYGTIKNQKMVIKPFWTIENQLQKEVITDETLAKAQLKELIENSVQQCLISDVPYGVFLSGGTDSSLVSAIAQKYIGNLNTFSIGFHEAKYNEAPYAKAISSYLKTNHHEFIVSFSDALSFIDDMTNLYDEPFCDASAIPTMLVSKLAKQEVSMVLSGDGGDELFWGYGSYHWAKRLSNPFIRIFRYPLSQCFSLLNNRAQRASYLFQYPDTSLIPSHIFSQEQYLFSLNEIKNLLLDFNSIPFPFAIPSSDKRILSAVEIQSLFDLRYYLKDDLLVKTDRASMKYALEVRVPLLDKNIVSFAINLAPSLKQNHGIDKYLLKQVLFDYIPPSYFNRPKWGFALPVALWLQNELKPLIMDYLSESALKQTGILQPLSVSKLIHQFFSGKKYLYGRIWNLLLLQKWLIHYNETAMPKKFSI